MEGNVPIKSNDWRRRFNAPELTNGNWKCLFGVIWFCVPSCLLLFCSLFIHFLLGLSGHGLWWLALAFWFISTWQTSSEVCSICWWSCGREANAWGLIAWTAMHRCTGNIWQWGVAVARTRKHLLKPSKLCAFIDWWLMSLWSNDFPTLVAQGGSRTVSYYVTICHPYLASHKQKGQGVTKQTVSHSTAEGGVDMDRDGQHSSHVWVKTAQC